MNYKVEGEKLKHKYTMDPDVPQFIQAKVNAFNISDVSIWPGARLVLLTWASPFQFYITSTGNFRESKLSVDPLSL